MSRRSLQPDAAFGMLFAALGLALAWAAWRLPAGIGGVPGPGVFPFFIGAGLAALGIGLVASARSGTAAPERDPAAGTTRRGAAGERARLQIVAILALLSLYAAAWDLIPFVWRTPALLLGIYVILGEPLLRSAAIAGAATALLMLVFDTVLRVRL